MNEEMKEMFECCRRCTRREECEFDEGCGKVESEVMADAWDQYYEDVIDFDLL